jgi:signal transduction histidine kinase
LTIFAEQSVSNIGIRIEREHDKIRLEIADNGKGFDPQAPYRGNGLANMEARATLLGGALRLESGEGKGARVVVEWAG